MATNTKGRGQHPGLEHDDQAASIIPHAITREVQLAQKFLATLPDARTPWADRYEAFAEEEGLDPGLRATVKVTILRLRMFGAIARYRPRPARRRR